MLPLIAPDRPDLRKQSVVFATVKGAGVGAVIGAAFHLGIEAIDRLRKKPPRGHNIVGGILSWAALWGGVDMIETLAKNRQKAEVTPYVQRLELELAAKNAILDDSLKR